jgi:MFS family permease
VGYGDTAAIYANLLIGVVNVLLTLVAIRLIDRIGREPLLLGGLVGLVASLAILGLSTLLSEPSSPSHPVAMITLVCVGAFIACFSATWEPTIWVMGPEVLPLRNQGTAMAWQSFCTGSPTSSSPRVSRACSPRSGQASRSSDTP